MIEVFFTGYGSWTGFRRPFPDSYWDDVPDYHEDPRFYSGVFTLSNHGDMVYRHTGGFDGVGALLPSTHPDRAKFPYEDIEYCGSLSEDDFKMFGSCGDLFFNIDTGREYQLTLAKPVEPESRKTLNDCQQNQTIGPSERQSMLKLIIGMAIDAYSYDPETKRQSATGTNAGSIQAALATRGILIDNETIKKYLDEAKSKQLHGPLAQ